jgi:hypothetical protein
MSRRRNVALVPLVSLISSRRACRFTSTSTRFASLCACSATAAWYLGGAGDVRVRLFGLLLVEKEEDLVAIEVPLLCLARFAL